MIDVEHIDTASLERKLAIMRELKEMVTGYKMKIDIYAAEVEIAKKLIKALGDQIGDQLYADREHLTTDE